MSDVDVMKGGPEQGAPATTELGTGSASPAPTSSPGASAPGMQEVTINGVTFAVSEAMAKAFEAQQEQASIRISDLQSGLDAARRSMPSPSAPVEPAGVDVSASTNLGTYNWETKLFENPIEAVGKIVELAEQRTTARLRKEYQEERARENTRTDFWKGFYEKNDHLKGKEKVVDFIVQRDTDLASMSLDKAAREIKERAEAFFKDAGVSIPGGQKGPPIVEGGPEKAPKTAAPEVSKDSQGKSLGSVLRERAKQRAQSRHTDIKMVK